MCSAGPVTCVTSTVAANVLQDRHIFGQQQAIFPDVPLHRDLVLVIRVYLDDGKLEEANDNIKHDEQTSLASASGAWSSPRALSQTSMQMKAGVPEENLTLVAWAYLPLAVHGKSRF